MSVDFELRLSGGDAPDGEIELTDLVNIGGALQELSLRIARGCLPSDALGRPNALLADVSQLRLRGLLEGSTLLKFSRGHADTLNVPLDHEQDIDDRFADVMDGIARNSRPEWVDGTVAESSAKLLKAMRQAAPMIRFQAGTRPTVDIDTKVAELNVWERSAAAAASEQFTISGRLEAVDLRTNRFRVVDDLSNSIRLVNVEDAGSVAPLIGGRVKARGLGRRGPDDKLQSLSHPVLTAAPLPATWLQHGTADLAHELSKPGPKVGEGIELDDAEYEDFLTFLTN